MSFTKKDSRRNLRILQIIEFANFGHVFAIPIMVDYVSTHIQGGGHETYFFITTITNIIGICVGLFIGAYSDFYNRKTVLQLSMVLKCLAWVLFIIYPTYLGIFLALMAYLISTLTCATSICLYESLLASGEQEKYQSRESTLAAYPQYALFIGLPLAGFLYGINDYWPYILNLVFSAIALFASFLYKEAPRIKTAHDSAMKLLSHVLSFMQNVRTLRWMTLYNALNRSIAYMIIYVFQAYYLELEGSPESFAIMLTFIYLVRAIAAQQTPLLFRLVTQPFYALMFILLSSVLLILLSGLVDTLLWMSVFMVAFMFIRGMQNPALNYVYNDLLTSDKRATAFSARDIIRRGFDIALNFIVALCITYYGAGAGLIIIAGLMATLGTSLLLLYKNAQKITVPSETDQR